MRSTISLLGFVVPALLIVTVLQDVMPSSVPNGICSSEIRSKREFRKTQREKGNSEAHSEPGIDWYIVPRTMNSDVPISKGLAIARQHMDMQERAMALRKEEFTAPWTSIGPFNIAGRSRVVVFDPTNDNIMYTGAASGGVWKTTDGGLHWEPKTDHFTTLAVGHIAIDKNNPSVVFAGTGEGSDNFDRVYGDGLYKSTDGGDTWTNIMASRDMASDECINKIALHPESSDTVYAAIRGSSSGLYKTTNGGVAWSKILSGVARDVAIDPNKPNRVYAILARNRGTSSNGLYVSDTNGYAGTFKKAGWPIPMGDSIGNMALDISPSHPGYLIAVCSKSYSVNLTSDGYVGNTDFLGVYKSTDYGETWVRSAASDYNSLRYIFRGQGDYNMYIRFHPEDPNIVFIGGIHNWLSTDFGENFTQITNYDTWVDLHYGDFSKQDPDKMAVASDGGVYLTNNCRAGNIDWMERGGDLATMQFYGMDYDPQMTSRVAGGTQDRRNNMLRQGLSQWERFTYGGDGGYVAFDAADTNVFYISSQYGNIARTTNGGFSFRSFQTGLPPTNRYNFAFVTPFVMNPDDSKMLFLGGQGMYRLNGETWEAISDRLTGDSSSFSAFQDLAICKGDPNIIWGVTGSNKRVFRSRNALSDADDVSWDLVLGDEAKYRLPGIFLSAIAVHPDSGNVAYVGTAEFQSRTGIYKTTDDGVSWVKMTGSTEETSLPQVPIGAIAIYGPDPDIVFAGTDVGVYISRNGGGDWAPFNDGLPRVVVDDLKITPDGILYAATHGRGMWMKDISLVSVPQTASAPKGYSLGQNYPNPFNPSTQIPYTVDTRAQVTLQVFDSQGRLTTTLVDRVLNAGTYTASFNAATAPTGTYYYRLSVNGKTSTRKMLLMK